jgi:hypothetical protein
MGFLSINPAHVRQIDVEVSPQQIKWDGKIICEGMLASVVVGYSHAT